MDITDVRIRKVNKDGKMKAIVSVTFDDEFVVHDIKVIEGDKGFFIAMPSRKTGDGEFRDIAHPITSETRNKIQAAILESYEEIIAEEADAKAAEEDIEEEETVIENGAEEEMATDEVAADIDIGLGAMS